MGRSHFGTTPPPAKIDMCAPVQGVSLNQVYGIFTLKFTNFGYIQYTLFRRISGASQADPTNSTEVTIF